ncbi:MAG: hypothetical protein FJ109_10710 [Deltaproteobacteria bacterium]|nr:hypothetical protein [Deltaproteobacteria bacterium]
MRKLLVTAVVLALITQSGLTFGLDSVTDCSATEKADIEAVANYLSEHWDDFEKHMESATDLNIRKCMKRRFEKNGDVLCKDNSATGLCECTAEKREKGKCAAAWAVPLGKEVRICQTFQDNVKNLDTQDRRACWAAILVHEFSHSCLRLEGGCEKVEKAAFDYWKSTHSAVKINKSDCGLD